MAKFRPGPAVGEISGSIGAATFSHNRYGMYMRTRVVPTNPSTPAQQAARSRLATTSENWRNLTSPARLTWTTWAAQNPIMDRLGQSQVLSPNAAFVEINSRLLLSGDTPIAAAPLLPTPTGLSTLTLTADVGAGDFQISFTPTPMLTNNRVWLLGAVTNSPTITQIKSLWRYLGVSAKAAATDLDAKAMFEAVFGTLSVGQFAFVKAAVFDSTTGLLSLPLQASAAVSHT